MKIIKFMRKKGILISTIVGIIGLFGIVYIVTRRQSTDIRDRAADGFDMSTCSYTVLTDGDLETANLLADYGDIVCIMPGTYTTPIDPTNNGESGNYILYKGIEEIGDDVILTEGCDFDGREYIGIEGIYFLSERYYWFSIDSASSFIEIENCTFNSTAELEEEPSSFMGIRINGSYVKVRGCRFLNWLTGDMVSIITPGNHVLIEYNDFSQAVAEHGQVTLDGNYSVVRHNYFRNPCDRSLAITYNVVYGDIEGWNLVEYNIIADSNKDCLDGSNACEGADQVVKIDMINTIFRNNLIIGANEGHAYELQGAVSLGTYTNVYTYENLRIYHNTIYSNKITGVRMSINTDTYTISNNAFKNNVMTESEDYEIYFQDRYTYNYSNGTSRGWLFDTNIIASSDDVTNMPVYIRDDPAGSREQTVEQANTNHEEFIGNIGVLPSYDNAGILDQIKTNPENYTIDDFDTMFEAFSLAEGSEGEDDGTYLTRVAQSGESNASITVEDARYFYDGEGVIEGDEIMIGTEAGGWQGPYEVESTDNDNNILTLDTSITVSSGDQIYLSDTGTDPDIGIYSISSSGVEAGEGGDGDTCIPDCTGRECGDNGCGGSCGTCSDGKNCKGYKCVEGESYHLYNADLNSDGKVDMFDLTILLNNWKIDGNEGIRADINGDDKVNIMDIAILKGKWTKKY